MTEPCEVPAGYPSGTTARKCKCGEIRVRVPGVLTDEWKGHWEYDPEEGGCRAQNSEDSK